MTSMGSVGVGLHQSEPYSPERLGLALTEQQPVFINLTADWCITCKINERVAINRRVVADTFAEQNVLFLKGDWTNADPIITQLLNEHGRSGVPLYLVYRPGGDQPKILPQVLTVDILVDAFSG